MIRLAKTPVWSRGGLCWLEDAPVPTGGLPSSVCPPDEVRRWARLAVRWSVLRDGWVLAARTSYWEDPDLLDRRGNPCKGRRRRKGPIVFRRWREAVEHLRAFGAIAADTVVPNPPRKSFAARQDLLLDTPIAVEQSRPDWRPDAPMPEDHYAW